jgi:7,8-dihydropterin-6-yl-methyl-4-(beta-D-ribofuranosyl)aminobenzene 5'-phosphate synthase
MKTSAFALLFLASLGFAPGLSGQTTPPSATATAPAVRLTILDDNAVARVGVKAVWGFACLVEARGHAVLFDTGADPAVLKDNLAVLEVAPARIEAVVLSHYHGDHTWGAPGLGTPPGVRVFTPRSFEGHPKETAALQSAGLTLVPISQATPLFDGITISEPLHFEGRIPFGGPGQGFTDEVWEQCLTVDTPDGLVVIAGCSHPGILAMLEQVKRQTGRPLYFVIGGFHLLGQPDAEVHHIATAMQAMGVGHVSATHCTGEAAAHVFRDVFGDRYVSAGVGTVIDLPLAATGKGSAQQPNAPPRPSPEHQKLALWFGEWIYEGDYVTTPLGPGGKFTGRMTGRPILDGFGGEYVFLENGPSGETRTVEIDSYDPVAKNYPNICICSDGSLGHIPYTMNGNVASWEGNSVIGGRRVGDRGTDAVASDGMSFTKKGEIRVDGKTWVPFVTLKATKVKAGPAAEISVSPIPVPTNKQ